MNPNDLSAKEFLKQAQHIDQRINSKLEQVASLRELATKATSTLSETPTGAGTRNVHRMEDVIVKMMDLESEINADIGELVATKREVMSVIKMVPRPEYQSLLELKYLCLKTWDEVAFELGYVYRQITRMHGYALEQVDAILRRNSDDER
jgi:hypothetical protein